MSVLVYLLIAAACVAADQAVKYWAAHTLAALPGGSLNIWEGVFHLAYVENRGAAFGIFEGARVFFIALTCLFAVGMVAYMLVKRPRPFPGIPMGLILGGAVGNLIDRVRLGYVVDMFYFKLIDFAVFNVADAALCVGVASMAVWVFFFMDREKKREKPPAPKGEPEEER